MYLFNKKDRVFCQHNVCAWSKKCCTELIWLLGHLVMTSYRREWWRAAGGRRGCWWWRTQRTSSLSSPSSSSPPPGEACRGRVQKVWNFPKENLVGSTQVRKIPHFFDFLFNPSLTHQQTMKHCQSSLSEDILNIWRSILEVQIDRYELTVSSCVWRGARTAGRRAGGTLSPWCRRRAGTAGTPSAAAGAQSRGLHIVKKYNIH